MAKMAEVTGRAHAHGGCSSTTWRAYAQADFSNVCCVGVDEMSVRKRPWYVSIFADLVAKRVLFGTEGKDKQTWSQFVGGAGKHNGHRHSIASEHGYEHGLSGWGQGTLPQRAGGV